MSKSKSEKASEKVIDLQKKFQDANEAFKKDATNPKLVTSYIETFAKLGEAQKELTTALADERIDEAIAASEAKVDEAIAASETKLNESLVQSENKVNEAIEAASPDDEPEVTEVSSLQQKHNEFMHTRKAEMRREFGNQKFPNRYGIKPHKAVKPARK